MAGKDQNHLWKKLYVSHKWNNRKERAPAGPLNSNPFQVDKCCWAGGKKKCYGPVTQRTILNM